MNSAAGERKPQMGLTALIVGAGVLLAAPAAVAKPGYVTFPAERESQATVKGSNGFEITVASTAGWVELTARKGGASAIYVVRRKGHGRGIQARFPGLGRVSLRFQPRGKPKRESGFCGGRGSVQQPGLFRGIVRFRGEQGFTRVAASRARGHFYRAFREVCRESGAGRSEPTPGYSLTALASSPGRTIGFYAFRSTYEWPIRNEATYIASTFERRRGALILRNASASTRPGGLMLGGDVLRPDSATVAPPSPFSGAASFHGSPGAPGEWEGTLAADLPGAGTVQLTGSSFESRLCFIKRCVGEIDGEGETQPSAAGQIRR